MRALTLQCCIASHAGAKHTELACLTQSQHADEAEAQRCTHAQQERDSVASMSPGAHVHLLHVQSAQAACRKSSATFTATVW